MRFSLFTFCTRLFTLNTTRLSIIACQKDSQCPSSTHFCNTQQNSCMLKHSLNSICQHDYCKPQQCGACIRNVHYANDQYNLFHYA
jgi:hypothetical protein